MDNIVVIILSFAVIVLLLIIVFWLNEENKKLKNGNPFASDEESDGEDGDVKVKSEGSIKNRGKPNFKTSFSDLMDTRSKKIDPEAAENLDEEKWESRYNMDLKGIRLEMDFDEVLNIVEQRAEELVPADQRYVFYRRKWYIEDKKTKFHTPFIDLVELDPAYAMKRDTLKNKVMSAGVLKMLIDFRDPLHNHFGESLMYVLFDDDYKVKFISMHNIKKIFGITSDDMTFETFIEEFFKYYDLPLEKIKKDVSGWKYEEFNREAEKGFRLRIFDNLPRYHVQPFVSAVTLEKLTDPEKREIKFD